MYKLFTFFTFAQKSSSDWNIDMVSGYSTSSSSCWIHARICVVKGFGWNRRRSFPLCGNRPHCQVDTSGRAITSSSICLWGTKRRKCYRASFSSSAFLTFLVFFIFGFLGIAWFLGFQYHEEGQASFSAIPTSLLTFHWRSS
ncbi:hypothetical protein OIU77_015224 [Salix suchowensis]|uniref:Uncharacterized protein n=1 Tax=Salix suchowensis TaxID=1278906 RepID=A0ABQ8ZSK3_9ROSI|nr:hypothetical protein OIU77_015224 [Salix suchowensis]